MTWPPACETVSIVQWLNAGLAGLAALFWLWASLMEIPDSQDHFISALRKQSRLNAIAAFFRLWPLLYRRS
jgi:hypothetical protein